MAMDANYSMPTVPLVAGGNMGNNDGFFSGGGLGALLIGSLLFGNGGFGGNRWGMNGGYPMAEGAQLGQLSGMQAQLTNLQGQVSQNSIKSELDSIESQQNSGLLAILGGIKDNASAYLQGTGQISTALASGNFTTLQSINGLGATVTAQNNQNALQQLNSFNQINTSMLQGFNEISRDNANGFNQLIMGQNALGAQLASCCCSIERSIAADGQETRALINNLYVQNLQGQLNDAKAQNSNLAQTITAQQIANSSVSTILSHLAPLVNNNVVV